MSRGYEVEERDGDRNREPEQATKSFPTASVETRDRSARKHREPDSRASKTGTKPRLSDGAIERWSALSERERGTLREIGRFRTIDAQALIESRYVGKSSAFRNEIYRLQRQGLLQRRSLSVGKNRDTLAVLALTKEGAALVRQDRLLPETQAVYANFVKPAEVPHDAAIYRMYQAEAAAIEAKGGQIRRVVLDYELKRNVYSKLARERDSAALEYARRQQEIADQEHLPVIDGKIVLPDLRIVYETPEGDLDHVDLELATEHYHRGHMETKARAGFKMYGFVSTSRGRRAEWEGRELTAAVLSL
jgi:hypothetical protein